MTSENTSNLLFLKSIEVDIYLIFFKLLDYKLHTFRAVCLHFNRVDYHLTWVGLFHMTLGKYDFYNFTGKKNSICNFTNFFVL